jgi:hypothetical protein
MSEQPQARREGDEFVVEFEDGVEQRVDMTSVMHRADAIAYRRYMSGEAKADDKAEEHREAAIDVARERRDDVS